MLKRIFDVVFALVGILLCGWLIILLFIILSILFKSNGFYRQIRIGQYAKPFKILKLRTIDPNNGNIPAFAHQLRKHKIDELPQFINVLLGEMSVVGPRPDIPGYYDKLTGENLKILNLRPGLTGLASLKYRNEEEILANQENPIQYNDQVIFPDKLKINLDYYHKQSFCLDIKIIWQTIFHYFDK